MLDRFERDGYCLIPGLLSPGRIGRLIDAFAHAGVGRLERRGETFGARNILAMQEVCELLREPALVSIVREIVGDDARPVRGLFFDKTEGANWPVPWHQDLTVALAARRDVDGWSAWSIKAGVIHAQPPVHVMERILTVRLHLDNCAANNGPLRVLPGTHRLGRLSRERIVRLQNDVSDVTCIGDAGSALMMRPLLLHASSPAKTPRHRRVLHLEFAPRGLLPETLAWAA
jgi:ectoine hydroxylase-related dioxygenase (phytanoyl-CoA dioxygenase family)